MHALRQAGLRVPEDVSIMGVDDIELAAYLSPPLTTISQSIAQMAILGVELLLEQLAGKVPARMRIEIAPELVVRESTAPPAGGGGRR
jgi:DNA-binding LacI/PurR family transcriptional regulator